MIKYESGDILQADSEALVNTVNCVGVMGRGIALQFKRAFPDNFKAYATACKKGEVQPGNMFVFDRETLTHPRYIINFPTKKHWREKSKREYIKSGLQALQQVIKDYNIQSIALPPLGCGLGGLYWVEIKEYIIDALQSFADTDVIVFEPLGAPEAQKMAKNRNRPKITIANSVLVCLIDRYLKGLLDPFISLLEIHKLLYFMQESGEPLQLEYTEGRYGPYARNLRYVLDRAEGYLISGYGDGDDNPWRPIELLDGALENANHFLKNHSGTLAHLDKVTDLVDGFESSFGVELLATVHWVVTKKMAPSLDATIKLTQAWNDRKKRSFSARHINIAYDTLLKKGWLGTIHN